jgi:hypothetical protein
MTSRDFENKAAGNAITAGAKIAVIPVRKPHGPKSGGHTTAQNLDEDNPR